MVASTLVLVSPMELSAPQLQMHVFEEQPVEIVQAESSSAAPQLEMHVFDNSVALQNNAVVAEQYTQPKEEKSEKVALSYVKAESYIKTGYRRDDLDWSIAAPDGHPNVLSELKWRDVEMATISTGTTLIFESNWLLNLDLLYGRIYNGDNQDSDYRGDNRTLEFSRSNNSGDEGSVLDVSVSTGYSWTVPFNPKSTYPNIEIRPQVGLSYYSQNFKITDGNQTLSTPAPEFGIDEASPLGPFPGANTTYDSTWFGPWVGLKSKLQFSESFTLAWNLEYHYANYDSTANWNLRGDLAHPESFTNEADGYGLIGDIGGELRLKQNLSLNLEVRYQDWQADSHGKQTVFLSDGSSVNQPFNGVYWKSFGANIGLVYVF